MSRKKILITGVCGLLGQNLVKVLHPAYDLIGVDLLPEAPFKSGLSAYSVTDISKADAVKTCLQQFNPDIVINTAAITNVDGCEKEQDKADLINHQAVRFFLDTLAPKTKLVQISSDYVFDGKAGPYSDEAKPNPISFYGLTKLRAEEAVLGGASRHLVVRTMVIFGNGINLRPDFITWVKNSLGAGKEITVVTDQTGNITLASNLAFNIAALIKADASGIFSLSGSDILSRYDIAVETAKAYGLNPAGIKPILTATLNQTALRPLQSGFLLNRAKTIPGVQLLSFKELLKVYDDEQKNINRSAHL